MKKILCTALIACLLLALTACGVSGHYTIKEVNYGDISVSAKEAGLDIAGWGGYIEDDKPVLETEGTTYEWFESNTVSGWFWLRSPYSNYDDYFFVYFRGDLASIDANVEYTVCPAFVIG
jgi:hypothetical protein